MMQFQTSSFHSNEVAKTQITLPAGNSHYCTQQNRENVFCDIFVIGRRDVASWSKISASKASCLKHCIGFILKVSIITQKHFYDAHTVMQS